MNDTRLADGESRVLHDGDRVILTPLPLDRRRERVQPLSKFIYEDCWLGRKNALEYMYCEHTIETLTRKLSPIGNIIRRSVDELSRVSVVIQSIHHLSYVILALPAVPD